MTVVDKTPNALASARIWWPSGLMVYLKCRVCWQIALTVFLCIVAIEGAILVPSVRSFERDLLLRIEESSLNALVTVVEIHGSAATSTDLAEFADPLARGTAIRGVILHNSDGEPLVAFGEKPSLNSERTLTNNSRLGRFFTGSLRTKNGTRYDVEWPREVTGLRGDVAVRLDASWIDSELMAFIGRIALLVLMISIFVSGGAMIVLGRTILRPMLQVRDAVVAAYDDPAQADTYRPVYDHRNEMGELVRALNHLLVRISRTHREDLAMLNAMVNETDVAITACDGDGVPVYANNAALLLCGCGTLDEMRKEGLPLIEPLHNGGAPLPLKELLADGWFSGEAVFSTSIGDTVPSYVNAGVLADDNDQPLRYYATITDISEVRETQERLHLRNLELAAAERTKSRFLANMSHEFRTPLNAIIGFSELVSDELAESNPSLRQRAYVDDIRKSGLHLLGIINDVLDMAKVESGAMTLQIGEVTVTDVIDDALRMVSKQIEERELKITVDIDKNVPSVQADELKFRQIMVNLLSNAVKFTPDGGAVSVSAHLGYSDTLGNHLSVVVADTGVGIAAGELQTILEPFGQGATVNSSQLGGTGLGLALCKALAEAHKGTFSIDSEIGSGTKAILCLPMAHAAKNAA